MSIAELQSASVSHLQDFLMRSALDKREVSASELLAIFANQNCWEGDYTLKRKRWVWTGPFIPPFEIATMILEEQHSREK